MHSQFVSYFSEPGTNEPLSIEIHSGSGDFIESGFFINETTGMKYPIIRGIPRFVPHQSENYAQSFGYQWHKWPRVQFESENVGKAMEGHTRQMWERITAFHERELDVSSRNILDIGCGSGRFIDLARSKGAKVIGVDYSGTVEVAQRNFRNVPNVCICQADALCLPFQNDSFDGAFSIGVLHHTPEPQIGVHEAYRVLGNSGWFAVSVYNRGGFYDFPTVRAWRKLFNYLWPFFKHYPPLVYTYFTNYTFRPIATAFPVFGKVIRLFLPYTQLPDLNWSLLDTFDVITPSYQSAHETYEVYKWLKDAGFEDIAPSWWGNCSFVGMKPASHCATVIDDNCQLETSEYSPSSETCSL